MKTMPVLGRAVLALFAAGTGLVLAVSGCATYQSPELPAVEVATISINPANHRLRFMAVDGVYLSAVGGLNVFAGRNDLMLRPGKRTIQIEYNEVSMPQTIPRGALLVFDAQPGQRYVVHERADGLRFSTWITTCNGVSVPLLSKKEQ
jgi:hypothetical protein